MKIKCRCQNGETLVSGGGNLSHILGIHLIYLLCQSALKTYFPGGRPQTSNGLNIITNATVAGARHATGRQSLTPLYS